MDGLMMDFPLTVTRILRHAERWHPEAEIVSRNLDGSVHRYTYGDAFRRIHKLGNALRRLGVERGACVGTLAWNNHRHLEAYYGISCLGAVCHTINPRLHPEQLKFIADQAEDRYILFDLTFLPLLEQAGPELKTVKGFIAMAPRDEIPDSSLPNLLCYEDLIADEPDQCEWPDLQEHEACALCYTSGTTGHPKGVLYSHRSTMLHALVVSSADWLGLKNADAILPVVPMFHVNAWGIPYSAVMNGTKLVFPGPMMTGDKLYELLDGERVTITAGVPTIWFQLLQYCEETGRKLEHLERLMVGGSAAPRSMIETFEREHDVRVLHGWGMTEMSPVGTISSLKSGMDEWPADKQYDVKMTQGRPLFGVEMKIVDEDGGELPHDGEAEGELLVRGFWVARSYFAGAGADSFTPDGWFRTGDAASFTPTGYMKITDRLKDLIKSGGEWISSVDLENTAVGHPDVMEAAVIAIPDPKWQERPLLVVVPKEGRTVSQDDMIEYLRGKVADWWLPDRIEIVDELPHSATGKIQKRKLRERFQAEGTVTGKTA